MVGHKNAGALKVEALQVSSLQMQPAYPHHLMRRSAQHYPIIYLHSNPYNGAMHFSLSPAMST